MLVNVVITYSPGTSGEQVLGCNTKLVCDGMAHIATFKGEEYFIYNVEGDDTLTLPEWCHARICYGINFIVSTEMWRTISWPEKTKIAMKMSEAIEELEGYFHE